MELDQFNWWSSTTVAPRLPPRLPPRQHCRLAAARPHGRPLVRRRRMTFELQSPITGVSRPGLRPSGRGDRASGGECELSRITPARVDLNSDFGGVLPHLGRT